MLFLWTDLPSSLSLSLLDYSISTRRQHRFPGSQTRKALSMFCSNHAPDMTRSNPCNRQTWLDPQNKTPEESLGNFLQLSCVEGSGISIIVPNSFLYFLTQHLYDSEKPIQMISFEIEHPYWCRNCGVSQKAVQRVKVRRSNQVPNNTKTSAGIFDITV